MHPSLIGTNCRGPVLVIRSALIDSAVKIPEWIIQGAGCRGSALWRAWPKGACRYSTRYFVAWDIIIIASIIIIELHFTYIFIFSCLVSAQV
jgi:phage-related protein